VAVCACCPNLWDNNDNFNSVWLDQTNGSVRTVMSSCSARPLLETVQRDILRDNMPHSASTSRSWRSSAGKPGRDGGRRRRRRRRDSSLVARFAIVTFLGTHRSCQLPNHLLHLSSIINHRSMTPSRYPHIQSWACEHIFS